MFASLVAEYSFACAVFSSAPVLARSGDYQTVAGAVVFEVDARKLVVADEVAEAPACPAASRKTARATVGRAVVSMVVVDNAVFLAAFRKTPLVAGAEAAYH